MPHAARSTARGRAATALARVAEAWPAIPPGDPDTTDLSPEESGLAVAIYRAGLKRWRTLGYLLEARLERPLGRLEPVLQGILMAGALQLAVLRQPSHAVVDEAVALAKSRLRKGAGNLVNAVLHRIDDLVRGPGSGEDPELPWTPRADAIPGERGTLYLAGDALPPPADWARHVAVATSHPQGLIERWRARYGDEATLAIAAHGVRPAPTVLALEPDFDAAAEPDGPWRAHAEAGFVVFTGSASELAAFVAAHPARRVQDPGTARPAEATRGLEPRRILDYCAGRGTKTVQLRAMHPRAAVEAAEIDADRRSSLTRRFEGDEAVAVTTPDARGDADADLLVLDVPCSNTGVLARRPEARYRYKASAIRSLVALQRRIVEAAAARARPGAHLLYATCSLEAEENGEQADWIRDRLGAAELTRRQMLPAGADDRYRDGSFHALFRL